ncbi:hypothetical protein [Alicyclobacillus dauci]|uniref:Uncharacterized protein n=1 Tax=Alicyclobacillus dauci TaxID=1475485 RepID=A0ABY6YYG5_9BACL|nr:hypothetical protein [Alicyclobacillus dauci]WAH35545.1 hypothetical protein NZD86_14765 [Alicyclobacillus dauci]
MRTFRVIYQLFKWFSMGYTMWRGTKFTRVLWLAGIIWRALRRQPAPKRPPRVTFTFVGPHQEEIYRRRGWRKIGR